MIDDSILIAEWEQVIAEVTPETKEIIFNKLVEITKKLDEMIIKLGDNRRSEAKQRIRIRYNE